MSEYKQKDNRGSLFHNEKKESETDRDYKGSARMVCPHCTRGFDVWLSGYINTGQASGKKYLGLAFKPIEEITEEDPAPAPEPEAADDFPF